MFTAKYAHHVHWVMWNKIYMPTNLIMLPYVVIVIVFCTALYNWPISLSAIMKLLFGDGRVLAWTLDSVGHKLKPRGGGTSSNFRYPGTAHEIKMDPIGSKLL